MSRTQTHTDDSYRTNWSMEVPVEIGDNSGEERGRGGEGRGEERGGEKRRGENRGSCCSMAGLRYMKGFGSCRMSSIKSLEYCTG